MGLVHLVYASRGGTFSNPQAALDTILAASRRNNEQYGVTGALFYDEQYFLQCLEGGLHEVNHLYRRILRDDRHSEATILLLEPCERRLFPAWSMALIPADETARTTLFSYSPQRTFNPFLLSGPSVLMLLQELAACGERRPSPAP